MKKILGTICFVLIFSIIIFAKEYEVIKGDTLWNIAYTFYKNPFLWKKIFEHNIDKIKNPNLIYPGQIFVLPELNSDQEVVSSKDLQNNLQKVIDENTTPEDNNKDNNKETNIEKNILFEETNFLGTIYNNNKKKLFYSDGDLLYFNLTKNVEIKEGEILYILHKGPSKFDVSLQNLKNDEKVIVGKARVKTVKDKTVELYLIRAYSSVVDGDLVVK